MIELFKNIVEYFLGKKYPMGAVESPIDLRNVSLSSIQKDKELPNIYVTDMPPTEDQGQKPKCVASSIHKIKELYMILNGEYKDLSDDDLYEQCKLEDGIPNVAGTFVSIGAKVICKSGIASKVAYDSKDSKDITKDRLQHKLMGYAFVDNNFESICQAIYQNKAIVSSVLVDSNWFRGVITKIVKSLGRHAIVFHGFRISDRVLIGQNSWGVNWMGKIIGSTYQSLKPGQFEIYFDDIQDLQDIVAFTDIPKEILDDVQKENYKFSNVLRFGSKDYGVKKLQERLTAEGFDCGKADGSFGNKTKNALIAYQLMKGIQQNGILDATTRNALNGNKSKLDLFCSAIRQHEGWYVGSRSFRNQNPGNLKYIGQKGATGQDKGGFAIFGNYDDGYNALKSMIFRACTTGSKYYNSNMTIKEFFHVYAPVSDNNNSDAYAIFVAQEVGVPVQTKMRELL